MKRPKQHVLEEESKRAFINLLPPEWIHRDKNPDYGIDMEVVIVEDGKVTNNVFCIQLKATESTRPAQKEITYKAETEHLKFWEIERLPVLILYYIKSSNTFYHLFAQRYIRENLSVENPDWRKRKHATIRFPLDSKLSNIKDLSSMATEGYLYIAQQQLNIKSETESATYWLDGIPKSDDEELKERTLKAFSYVIDHEYTSAIDEFEKILRVCTISPTEKMSILINLGNAYLPLGQNDNALKNYEAILDLTKKVNEKTALEGKSAALGNIGLILRAKGDFDRALRCLKDALIIHKKIRYKQGEAKDLGNIGIIFRMRKAKGDFSRSLKYLKNAIKIHKEIGEKLGEASDLGNIGLSFMTRRAEGDLNRALKYYKDALKIHREIGYKLGEASGLGNIGLILAARGYLGKSLKYHKGALKIYREIGDGDGEARALSNIGLIYKAKGEADKALKYLKEALNILDRFNLVYGRDIIQKVIDSITK